MKKVFAILTLAAVMTACNNEGKTTETPAGDSVKTETPAVNAVADSAANMMDKVADSAKSLMNKVADSAKAGAEKVVEKAKEAVKH